MKTETSVIIPNWNGEHLLKDCLDSLEKQSYKNFEIIIVDNGSTDSSIEFIKNNFPKIKIIKLEKNLGFAKAVNIGVKKSKAKFIVLLNNDTEVDKDWLKNLVKIAKKYKDVGSVGSKLLNFYERRKIDGVGIQINEVGQARSIGYDEKDKGQYEKQLYVFGVTGGASLFKREIFIKIGMFDENYFMYSEEVDWAFRAQFQGFKAIYCPKAIVYHKHKASSSKKPQHLEYWQFKNMTQTILKDMPFGVMLKNYRWLKIILVHFNTIFYQIKNGFLWPPVLTEVWLLIHLPELLIKRYKIQKNKKVNDIYLEDFLVPKEITFWGILK